MFGTETKMSLWILWPICKNKNLYQYLAALSGSLAVLTSGINLGWTSPYLPQILNGRVPDITMTSAEGYWCAVMPLAGAPLGAFTTVMVVDKLGRKTATLLLAPVTFLMFILLAFAKTTFLICLARFVIGSVEGGLYTALPMYFGEISLPSVRGFLTASIAIASIIGTLLINVLGFYYSIFTSSIVSALIPVIHFITFVWMPESPYYLIKKSKHEEARQSLQILRGGVNVEHELKSLQEAVARQESSEKSKITDLFTVKSNRRAVLIFVILNLTKKFSGKNPFQFYTATIFQSANSGIDPNVSAIIYISLEVLAIAMALIIVDRAGRKPIIIFSTVGCIVALVSTGAYFFLKDGNPSYIDNLGWLPLTALGMYIICCSLGLEVAPTVFLGELFPINIKAVALGLADTLSIVNGIISSKVFQALSDIYGMFLPFWVFSGCCTLGLVFILMYVPETKNKTLEEIQVYLIRKTEKAGP